MMQPRYCAAQRQRIDSARAGFAGKLYRHLEGYVEASGTKEGGWEAGRALTKHHICRRGGSREQLLFGKSEILCFGMARAKV